MYRLKRRPDLYNFSRKFSAGTGRSAEGHFVLWQKRISYAGTHTRENQRTFCPLIKDKLRRQFKARTGAFARLKAYTPAAVVRTRQRLVRAYLAD